MSKNIDTKVRITLQAPHTDKTGRFFSLRLKPNLSNEPVKYRSPSRMLVLSGFEGDFQTFCRILLRNRVVDKHLRWIFGEGHLVIISNCFSDDKRSVEFLWFIYSLEEKAQKSGGYVHFILGNNEVRNLNGSWRYQHPRYAKGNKSIGNAATALYDANNEIWRWLQTKNVMEKIGRYLFVHGGISHELLELDLPITRLNRVVRKYYNTVGTDVKVDPLSEMLVHGEGSPIRYNGYYQHGLTEDQMIDILKYYRVNAIITGYARVERVTVFCSGKVVNIATAHQEGVFEALLIVGRRFYRVDKDGRREKIRSEF